MKPENQTPEFVPGDTVGLNEESFGLKAKRVFNGVKTFFSVPANTILVFFVVLLLILNVFPLLSVIKDSLFVLKTEPVPGARVGDFTFAYWKETLASEISRGFFWKPLGRSFVVSVFSCLFALLFGGGTAFLICRTNMPFKKFISAVFIFPYIMPQWTLALFWKNFFISTACRAGHIGEFQALTGAIMPEWFVYGPFSISIVLGLHYAPFAYILLGGVLRNMDANLEEAATILNIPKWKTFFKVTIPMLTPAILSTILLVFTAAMSSYPIAQTLGSPVEYFVLAVRMKGMIQGTGGAMAGMGAVVSIVLILLGVIILFFNQRATSGRKQYTTVSGKAGQATKQNLGKVGRWVTGVIMIILIIFFCFGPMVSFLLESMIANPGDYSNGLTTYYWTTNENIRNNITGVFNETDLWSALRGSILLSVLCALAAGTMGLLIGYAISKKRKSKLAQTVNGLSFFPYLIPSISLSACFFFLSASISWLYKLPLLVCVILGTMKYIPFASRSSLNAMMQLSGEIEEAAVIQNVPWWKRMVRIVFPIQKSAFLSGYLLPFISCMRELNLFLFIGGNSIVLTRYMYFLEDTGIPALENAANLILVIIILVVNWLVNLLTGASIDKGVGGK